MIGLEALQEIGTTLMFINKNTLESKPLKEVMPNYYNIIEQSLKALEIIKRFIWVEDGKLNCGRYGDVEIELDESDFEDDEEELDLLKEVLE